MVSVGKTECPACNKVVKNKFFDNHMINFHPKLYAATEERLAREEKENK